MKPPMTPNGPSASPVRVKNAGMIVWYGRFPGPTQLGWPGSRTKQAPRFCSAMPVPGTTIPLPKPM